MNAAPHADSGMQRAISSEVDYPAMSWRGWRIHAVGIGDYEHLTQHLDAEEFLEHDDLDDTVPPGRLLLDIDSIVRTDDPLMLMIS